MNSREISLTIATVFTIFSRTVLPSHANQSCPLGFTSAGAMGCQKVVKVKIKNICASQLDTLDIRVGRDLCRRGNGNGDIGQPGITYSVPSPETLRDTTEKLTKDPDPGFTNPGAPIRQRRVVLTSGKVVIDCINMRQDCTEITFDVIIPPNVP
jgi:hypothetical protein